jgi:hypothetical protein
VFSKVVREAPQELPSNVTRAAADAGLGAYEVTWKPQFAMKMIFGMFIAVWTVGMAVAAVRNPPRAVVRRVVDDFSAVRVLTPRGWRDLYGGRERSMPDVHLLDALARRLGRS